MDSLRFCSGFGSSDTHADKDDNRSPNRGKPYPGISVAEIAQLAADPPSVDKATARWFIPSTHRESDARGHSAQREHGQFWWLPLDVDSGNLDKAVVCAALEAVCGPTGRIVHSSRSSTPEDRKWRALIPLSTPIDGRDYRDTVLAFYACLTRAEPTLTPDTALARPGQLVYLPNRGKHYESEVRGGARLELYGGPIIAERERARAEAEIAHAEAQAKAEARARARVRAAYAGDDIPGAFNAQNQIADLLIEYGYENADDMGLSEDWRSPYQESGSYATRDYGSHWISMSASDARAGLGAPMASGHRFGDAFDLYKHFAHNDDERAAIKAAAKALSLDRASDVGPPEDWFEPVADTEPSPFDVQAESEREAEGGDIFPLLTIDEIVSRPPPTFLIDRHIPDVSMGFLYSDPGVGKSFLALDMALSIAHGLPDWHGDAIKAKEGAVVVYIASEGSFDLRNRIRAWHKARGIEDFTKRFLVIERTINFMHPDDVQKLVRTIRAAGVDPALTIVDTVSRAMPGSDENLQKDMTVFVQACDAVRDAFACAVLGVHHAGKSGDMRGSTVLRGAGDFVMKLERKRGASVGTMTMEKQKAAADGWNYQILFEKVGLDDGQSSLVPSRAASVVGQGAELTPAGVGMVFEAMRAAWDAGEPWSKAARSGDRYAVSRMVWDFNFKGDEAEQALALWEASGFIRAETVCRKSKKVGFRVVAAHDNLSADEAETAVAGVFD